MPAQPTRDIDDYIAAAPEGARPMLKELRETIRAAAPEAEERISYGMPYYQLHGVRLTYFQAHTRHVGLYAFTVEDARAVGLEQHIAAKSTLQFPLDQPLPTPAIRRLIEVRVKATAAKPGAKSRLGVNEGQVGALVGEVRRPTHPTR
jgi:uncharacterized protein YdhG (YjbR/CyaY superfamily)